MKTRMNFKDEFYQKLKLLVLPIAIQNFMLALVSATDAIMLGWIDQTSHQPAVLRPVYHPCRFLSRNADAHLYK